MEEFKLLSSALLSAEVAQLIVTDLSPEQFYEPGAKNAFLLIESLVRNGMAVTKEHFYAKTSEFDISGPNLQNFLMGKYSMELCLEFIETIKKKHVLRQFRGRLPHFMDSINEDNFEEQFKSFAEEIQGLQIKKQRARTLSEIGHKFHQGMNFLDYLKHLKELWKNGESMGLVTGYPQMDEILCCIPKGALVVVGARPSVGKTTFGLNLLSNMIEKNRIKGAIISMEMRPEQLYMKQIAACSSVGIKHLARGQMNIEQLERVNYAWNRLCENDLLVDEIFSTNVANITSRIRFLKKQHGVSIVMIDYLTKIKGDSSFGNKHNEVDSVSKSLQSIALQEEVTILLLAQFNRSSVKDGTARAPTLADFRESGSIEEDADVCILLHRPSMYNPNDKPGRTEAHISKNRNFENLGRVDFAYHEGKMLEERPLKQEVEEANEGRFQEDFNRIIRG